jgi:hypothetical protein
VKDKVKSYFKIYKLRKNSMPIQNKQNTELFKELTTSGKSLLQLYTEIKEERDQLAVALSCKAIGIPYVSSNELFLRRIN